LFEAYVTGDPVSVLVLGQRNARSAVFAGGD
jgi:hypothetical protein